MFNNYVFLYVEDDPLSREIMKMIMTNIMGVSNLVLFEDSHNFMSRIEACSPRPQVLLLDIHIQPSSGFEILRHLRESPDFKDAIAIALTASVMNEEVEQLRLSGFNGAIAKPLSLHTFPNLIERILQGEAVWHIAES